MLSYDYFSDSSLFASCYADKVHIESTDSECIMVLKNKQ